jgi:hypothetical protein
MFGTISTVTNAQDKITTDSIKVTSSAQKGERNVMLNAASANAGPRNVNIVLPASVGGATVLENDLPVVYFFWPRRQLIQSARRSGRHLRSRLIH